MSITEKRGTKHPAGLGETRQTTILATARRGGKKRVGCYCRVSTRLDDQADSIVAQRLHFVSLAEADPDAELVAIYYEAGISGTEARNRPEFQRMMADCRAGKLDEIWVKSISRWARNTVQLLDSLRELKDLGVNVVFEKEHLSTEGSSSELMLALIGSFAEFESKSIRLNTKMGYRMRMQRGEYRYKRPPYGYDATEAGELVPNPGEAPVVARIFRMCLEGFGSVRIANALQSEGIPTKRGAPWQPGTVRAILANLTYTGDVVLQKTIRVGNEPRKKNDGSEDQYLVRRHHAPIVSHAVYSAAQAAVERRAKGRAKGDGKSDNRYAFSGKLTCAYCGKHLHRLRGSARIQWICTGHRARGCPMMPVPESEVQSAFMDIAANMEAKLDACDAWMGSDGPALRLKANRAAQRGLEAVRSALDPAEYARRLDLLVAEEVALRRAVPDPTVALRRAARRIAPNSGWMACEPLFTEQVRCVRLWTDGRMEFVFSCGAVVAWSRSDTHREEPFQK